MLSGFASSRRATDRGNTSAPAPLWRLACIDFAGETDPAAAARSWISEDAARAFDLVQGPLFRYALLRVGPDHYFWSYVHHHICLDGYSLWLEARRVADLYTALRRGSAGDSGTPWPVA